MRFKTFAVVALLILAGLRFLGLRCPEHDPSDGTLLGNAHAACEAGIFGLDMLLILIYMAMVLSYMCMSALSYIDVGSRLARRYKMGKAKVNGNQQRLAELCAENEETFDPVWEWVLQQIGLAPRSAMEKRHLHDLKRAEQAGYTKGYAQAAAKYMVKAAMEKALLQANAAAPHATEDGQKHTPATPATPATHASGKPHTQASNTGSPPAGKSESRPSTGVTPSSPAAPSSKAAAITDGTPTTGGPPSTPTAPSSKAAATTKGSTPALIFSTKPQIVPAAPPTAGQPKKEVIPIKQQQQSLVGQVKATTSVKQQQQQQQQQQQSLAAPALAQVVDPVAPAGSTAHLTVNTNTQKDHGPKTAIRKKNKLKTIFSMCGCFRTGAVSD